MSWLLQPQFVLNLFLFLWAVWNYEKSRQKDKALNNNQNNADRLYFEEISVHLSKITDQCENACLFQTIAQTYHYLQIVSTR